MQCMTAAATASRLDVLSPSRKDPRPHLTLYTATSSAPRPIVRVPTEPLVCALQCCAGLTAACRNSSLQEAGTRAVSFPLCVLPCLQLAGLTEHKVKHLHLTAPKPAHYSGALGQAMLLASSAVPKTRQGGH